MPGEKQEDRVVPASFEIDEENVTAEYIKEVVNRAFARALNVQDEIDGVIPFPPTTAALPDCLSASQSPLQSAEASPPYELSGSAE